MIFENYKKRVVEKYESKSESRAEYILMYFNKYDKNSKGYLTVDESKQFFAVLLDLNYDLSKDRVTFWKIMKVVDVENKRIISKANIL